MAGGGAARWFHTLVVVGASLSACGGRAENDAPAPGSGGSNSVGGDGGATSQAGAGGGLPRFPSDCSDPREFACTDYQAQVGCHCNPAAPRSPTDCANPFAYQCTVYVGPEPPGQIIVDPVLVGCACRTSFPSPADCADPVQFICDSITPQYAGCRCDSSLPTMAGECERGCLVCESDNPRFGCQCGCYISLK